MNTQAQEPESLKSLRIWFSNVSQGYVVNHTVNTHTEKEVLMLLDAVTKPETASWLRNYGFKCWQRGNGAINKNGFTFYVCREKSKPFSFTVLGPSAASVGKRKQAVTETSREAYHTLDFSTQRGKIAQVIFEFSQLGKDITRQELTALHNFPTNAVCGRVKELLEASEKTPFEFEGRYYRLVKTEPRLSRFPGASPVKNEGLRWMLIENQQTSLF